MKIRLLSTDAKVGNLYYNEEKLEEGVKKASQDKVDVLITDFNNLYYNDVFDYISDKNTPTFYDNESYKNAKEKVEKKFTNFLECYKDMDIISNNTYLKNYKDSGIDLIVRMYKSEIATLEYLSNIENRIKAESILNQNALFIYYSNDNQTSVCKNIYSNIKIIAYNGEILVSNRKDLRNVVDYEFDYTKKYSKTPYLDNINRQEMFDDILNLQGIGLYGKMRSMDRFKICMGISGGLDSTCCLLACVEIFKKYNLPLENIIGVTMPGLGTTERTYNNAINLMKNLGITIRDIDLKPLLKTHLKNINQPDDLFDITYEQTQSRERTQVLLDIANQEKAIMIGTGCMSEFALGWMTYGGDHLSMYALNIGLPKTVVRLYTNWLMNRYYAVDRIKNIIIDILEGPVSPELLPIDEKGEQHEKTENLIGDYIVQDFFIYHMTVNNYSIKKIFNIACKVFTKYEADQILKWLEIFALRYFTRAYKKNCYGDGLQLFKYCVAPWYYEIPSDIDYTVWKEEIEELKKELE